MSGILEKLHLKHAHNATPGFQQGTSLQSLPLQQQSLHQGGIQQGTSLQSLPLQQQGMMNTTPIWNPGQKYSGLNLPYNGGQNHPQYGYQRLTPAQKAERFEQKALEWERRGNPQKAQKNREKALKYRARLQPGYVRPQRTQAYYTDRANLFNQKALQYQQWGMQDKYQRYLGRANRIRAKQSLPAFSGVSTSTTLNQPLVHQTTHVIAPIIQETVRQDRVIEVQPVVHREVDKNVVHHIEKHYTETAPSMSGTVELAPVVEQQVRTNVVNEIQPIIHRERVVPIVERTEQHLTQHVVQPTIHTHEVVYESGPYVAQAGMVQTGMMQTNMVQTGMVQPGMVQTGMMQTGMVQPGMVGTSMTQQYSGLNFPYSNYGAVNHPQYGYQRLPHNRKAERFEAKALEWERKGNLQKAQKNREKAMRYRAKSQPGYVAPVRPQNYYIDRANLFNQKALQYQQMGMLPQYQRYQGRADRIRAKRGLPPFQPQQAPLYTQGISQDQLLKQQAGLGAPGSYTSAR